MEVERGGIKLTQLKDIDVTEIQNLLELRAFAYDVLRRTFLEEPSKELVEQFQNGVIAFFPFKEENTPLKEGVEQVNHYFKTFKMDEHFDDVHWDYTRMFIGPYELQAPLWESSYTNREGLLFQEETLRVRRLYLENCFESLQYGKEADDHLGLELDFMYQLTNIARDLLNQNNISEFKKVLTDQDYFLKNHLLNWTPRFAKTVIANAETDFYKGMVKVLVGYLAIDKACLEEIFLELNV